MTHYSSLLQGPSANKTDIPPNTSVNGPLDYEISMDELTKASTVLKPGKSPDVYEINNEMIQAILNHCPEAILHTFNTILRTGGDINKWCVSLLVPIHKKGPKNDPNNYRGIALMSCLAKFFYSILNARLLDFCKRNNVLSPTQLGILPGNRTSDAHIIIHNLINKYCHKKGKWIYGCFVDFSKAFDNLPRDLLFEKLKNIGITGKFYDILKSIYENDKISIKIDDKKSPPNTITKRR